MEDQKNIKNRRLTLLIDSLFNTYSSLGVTGYELATNFLKKSDKYNVKTLMWNESDKTDEKIVALNGRTALRSTAELNNIDVSIRKSDPYTSKDTQGKLKISYVYYDGINLNPETVKAINSKVDVLAVPSQNTKNKFIKFGVTIPVEVVPLGVDLNNFYVTNDKKQDKFTFINFGEQSFRKGTGILIKAFNEEFKDEKDVQLIVISSKLELPDYYEKWGSREEAENIKYIRDKYSIAKLRHLLNSSHCYVAPTRADSFGMPGLEAMACGLPVIATKNTGYEQYIVDYEEDANNSNGSLTTLKPEENKTTDYPFAPDINELKVQMRMMYRFWKSSSALYNSIRKNAIKTACSYTWGHTVSNFELIINKYYKQ